MKVKQLREKLENIDGKKDIYVDFGLGEMKFNISVKEGYDCVFLIIEDNKEV